MGALTCCGCSRVCIWVGSGMREVRMRRLVIPVFVCLSVSFFYTFNGKLRLRFSKRLILLSWHNPCL